MSYPDMIIIPFMLVPFMAFAIGVLESESWIGRLFNGIAAALWLVVIWTAATSLNALEV